MTTQLTYAENVVDTWHLLYKYAKVRKQ